GYLRGWKWVRRVKLQGVGRWSVVGNVKPRTLQNRSMRHPAIGLLWPRRWDVPVRTNGAIIRQPLAAFHRGLFARQQVPQNELSPLEFYCLSFVSVLRSQMAWPGHLQFRGRLGRREV